MDWITDLNSQEYWENTTESESPDGFFFEVVNAKMRLAVNEHDQPIDYWAQHAVIPVEDLYYLLEKLGYTFQSGTLGKWAGWDKDKINKDRAFVIESGQDLLDEIIDAGIDAKRATGEIQ